MPPNTHSEPVTILKSLADPGRLLLARLLLEGAFNVSEITDILAASQSTISRHLRILQDAGLLDGRREGRQIFYAWSTELAGPAATMRAFVAQHGPELPEAVRRRVALSWESRRERSASFFRTVDAADPAAAWLGSPDCLPHLVQSVPSNAVVADVGTGTGRLLELLFHRARKVIGVDASPEMLSQARGRLVAAGASEVDLRLGDMAHLPLEAGEVDCAVVNMALHHVPEPVTVLRELRRVLAPGGLLLVGDFLPHDEEWMRETLADQWLGFAPADLSHWLDLAGFGDVDITPLPSDSPGALDVFVARANRRPSAAHNVTTQPRAGA
ncbi:MAG: metalloregulator ArsR/SmtB family transcription factor [Deltaproteobacteria bacterium]|nr:metalloregulator ArsR/SmtB family transcription factor [Deltaproteobacteria bacterium]